MGQSPGSIPVSAESPSRTQPNTSDLSLAQACGSSASELGSSAAANPGEGNDLDTVMRESPPNTPARPQALSDGCESDVQPKQIDSRLSPHAPVFTPTNAFQADVALFSPTEDRPSNGDAPLTASQLNVVPMLPGDSVLGSNFEPPAPPPSWYPTVHNEVFNNAASATPMMQSPMGRGLAPPPGLNMDGVVDTAGSLGHSPISNSPGGSRAGAELLKMIKHEDDRKTGGVHEVRSLEQNLNGGAQKGAELLQMIQGNKVSASNGRSPISERNDNVTVTRWKKPR